ncbi:MAG TPA: SUF system NifU family Fe-S cluster assembly protein [Bryobacteraceae bacterium]|nr:SUF system NifU family Fe-S cluster assembly protein [Bryobacteraceae bacterium]
MNPRISDAGKNFGKPETPECRISPCHMGEFSGVAPPAARLRTNPLSAENCWDCSRRASSPQRGLANTQNLELPALARKALSDREKRCPQGLPGAGNPAAPTINVSQRPDSKKLAIRMSYLDDLHQKIIFEHCKRPRNLGPIQDVSNRAQGCNPECGDELTIELRLENDRIADIGFHGSSCAIAIASASVMTECVKGKTQAEALSLFDRFQAVLAGESIGEGLGSLAAFAGFREHPARVKCATLPWRTLRAALSG